MKEDNIENLLYNDDFTYLSESIEDYYILTENVIENLQDKFYKLTKYDLTKEDLSNPEKVKSIVKKISSNVKNQHKKNIVKAIIILFSLLLACIVSIFSISTYVDNYYKDDSIYRKTGVDVKSRYKSLIGYFSGLIYMASTPFLISIFATNDYEKMIALCTKQINKLEKDIYTENTKKDSDKDKIKEMKNAINKIKETQNILKSEMKKALK